MKASLVDVPSNVTLASSTTTVGSSVVWGLTQQEWAIYLGMGTAILAVLSFIVQLYLAAQKSKLYRLQAEAIIRGNQSGGQEDHSQGAKEMG